MASTERTDVIVIGGGPGGSTAAAALARAGIAVVLLEREHFPRPHVGESLLPASMPVLEAIGAIEAVEAAGFLKKWGATMVWGTASEPWAWFFRETNTRWPHSYQVERAVFDDILLRNAAANGVDVREGHRVVEVIESAEGALQGVRFVDDAGATGEIRADIVVDASGQASVIGRARGERQWDDFFRNLAIYGYFEGAGRLDGEQSNNILVEAFDDGWAWTIPLRDGINSVGVVLDSERAQAALREVSPTALLGASLRKAPNTWSLVEHARLQDEPNVIKDWSYASDQVVGDGWILVGDAACFVDPLFSSGVHLAMNSGWLASAYIRALRADPDLGQAAAPVYASLYRTQYQHFHQLAKLFYSSNQTADSYFWEARTIVEGAEGYSPRHAFINAVAGQPPAGYERVVLERGHAPADFADQVAALEDERHRRRQVVEEAGSQLLGLVPVLAEDSRVLIRPAVDGGEFVWSHVIDTPARPDGLPCSPVVAEILNHVDGNRTLAEVIERAQETYPALDASAATVLATLYIDGVVHEWKAPADVR